MSQVCPFDGKGCCDDLCHGSGCMRSGGEEMVPVCDECHAVIWDHDELPDTGYMNLCGKCMPESMYDDDYPE